jgi:putative hydrolase of the HAD superfamily
MGRKRSGRGLGPRLGRALVRSSALVWLLDLDNTLHDASAQIMPRINLAMTDYVSRRLGVDQAQASELRANYWRRYGATLLGMVRHHEVDAHEFLREVHPFPDMHRIVDRDHGLRDALRRLPGRKIVLTNGPNDYARAVLGRLGIAAQLDGLLAIESMQFAGRFLPKPSRSMLLKLLARLRVPASRCVLVEDSVANLRAARACRVRTVLVTGMARHGGSEPAGRIAGRGRQVGLQVQSAASLPRIVHKLV